MKKPLREERILQKIKLWTETLDFTSERLPLEERNIKALSEETGIAANNISTELGKLFRDGKLVKVGARPVCYLSRSVLRERSGLRFDEKVFLRAEELSAYLKKGDEGAAEEKKKTKHGMLIGANRSLAAPIRQAKAALRYPPHGIHTLLTGPTGVGKSLFAQYMFEYARDAEFLSPEARLVTLNCANYAENPQLLLSQLFGYVKGAYTGANVDHKGMVEYASGGILFLDEIHRLNPEGQEKLFRLIDYGKYSRLGETGDERTAQVLIIGATTEDAPNSMLSTFLRRLPVHIELPPLNRRSMEERMELVFYSLWREAKNIRVPIELDIEILNALCFYRCPANLGQLAMDIKITCANAYLGYQPELDNILKIKAHHLNPKIIEGLFVATNQPSVLVLQRLRHPNQPICIDADLDFEEICDNYLKFEKVR